MKENYKDFEIEIRQERSHLATAGEKGYFSVHIHGFPTTLNDIQGTDFETEEEARQATHKFLDDV